MAVSEKLSFDTCVERTCVIVRQIARDDRGRLMPDTGLPDTGLPDTGLPDRIAEQAIAELDADRFDAVWSVLASSSWLAKRPVGGHAGHDESILSRARRLLRVELANSARAEIEIVLDGRPAPSMHA